MNIFWSRRSGRLCTSSYWSKSHHEMEPHLISDLNICGAKTRNLGDQYFWSKRNLIHPDFFFGWGTCSTRHRHVYQPDRPTNQTRLKTDRPSASVGRLTTPSIIKFVDIYPRGKYTHINTDEVLSKNTLSHDKQATMKNIHSLNTEISHYTFPSQLAGYEPLPE